MTQKGFAPIILVFIFLLMSVVGLVGAKVYVRQQAQSSQNSPTTQQATVAPIPTNTSNANQPTPTPSIQQQTELVLPIHRVPNSNLPANLFINLSGPTTAAAGSTVVYSLTFGNNGPVAASDVFIGLQLPDGAGFVSDTIGGVTEEAPGGRIWVLGTIAAGSQRTATLSISLPPTAPAGTALTTTLNVQAATSDPKFANNIATITTQVM